MIKKLLILIICAVMFSACDRQPVSSTIENESNSTKKHYSFAEITQQVTMADFEDWDKYVEEEKTKNVEITVAKLNGRWKVIGLD